MTATTGLVTVLFTDVVGSTAISTEIGDLAADELRRLHFDDLGEAIALTGGTLVKTIGDAVMATYTGAAEALNGAVEMQRAVARRNRRAAGQDLHIRIGVSAGDATLEDGDWFGTPVIEASRLCAAAEPDQILISNIVGALAGSRCGHRVDNLGPRELKGLGAPLEVSEVEWQVGAATIGVPLPGFVDLEPSFAFAGRAGELDTVRAAWKDAIEQRRRLVLISGEPGVGKTRLVTEFVRTAHADGGTVLWGRCDEELDMPYQPFVEALRLYVAAVPDDVLRDELGPVAGELSLIVPELTARLPGVSIRPVGDVDAERHRLFEAVGHAFGAIAQTNAVVLVLDDIHWADKASLLLLRHLLRRSDPVRLLVLGTYRDTDLDRSHPLSDVLADLRREQGVERLDLAGLDIGEITAFMELAAGHELDEPGLRLVEAVHRETEGNAFFLSEMIRHLAESGYIVQREGRWVSDYTLDDLGIPEGIREVIGRRLSALSPAVNAALSVAAVIGPEFDIATVEAAGGHNRDDVFDALDEAVRASVVREIAGSYGRYAFAHALVRSTLYDELSTNRRVRLHWRIGTVLAERHGEHPDHLDQIAHHLAEGALAGDASLAVDYNVRAAERAVADVAFEAAVSSYDRALGAFELLGDGDLGRRFDIELDRIHALRAVGDERYRIAAHEAATLARRLGDAERLARSALALDVGPTPGNDPGTVALVREALDALGAEPSALRARLLMLLAVHLYWSPNTDERFAVANEATDMARGLGDAGSLAYALSRVWTVVDPRRPNAAQIGQAAEEVLALADPGTASHLAALENLCASSAIRGQTDDALAYLARYRQGALDARLAHSIWRSMVTSSSLATHLGESERAEQEATDALGYAQAHGFGDGALGSYGAVVYNVRRSQGRSHEMMPLLSGLVESEPHLPVWRAALAGAAYFARDHGVVGEQFDWLVADDFGRIPLDVEYPVTLCGLGRLVPAVDADARVCRAIYEALEPLAGLMNYTGTSIADANDIGLACTANHLGWHDVADGHFADAIALADRARALPYALHYRYEWARALVDRGDPGRARPLLVEVAERAAGRGMDGPAGYVTWAGQLLDEIS